MEPLSKIFESLKESSNLNKSTQSKCESKTCLTKKLSSIKNERLVKVTEALNAKREENINLKNENKNLNALKRHIGLSRKFESVNKDSRFCEPKRSKFEALLRNSDEENLDRSRREKLFKSSELRRECGLKQGLGKSELRRERDEFINRLEDSKRRESARLQSEENDFENSRQRRCCRTRRENIDQDIDNAERRFLSDLRDGAYESLRRRYRRY